MTAFPRLAAALLALVWLGACGQATEPDDAAPARAPVIDLSGIDPGASGLPDPCAVLANADVEALLVRPLVPEPFRHEGLCLRQVQRAESPEQQVSAALELVQLPRTAPTDLDTYWERYGEGVGIAGATREDIVELDGLGSYALWFPHADGSLTLTVFFAGDAFLAIEVHGVERERALAWARDLASQLVEYGATRAGGASA